MDEKISYRVAHVGISHSSLSEADSVAETLSRLFNLDRSGGNGNGNFFVGPSIEIMDHRQNGTYGHIGLETDDVEAAMAELAARGISFREETFVRDETGKVIFTYLKPEISGFAFHLMQTKK